MINLTNKIISSISVSIRESFGKDYKIYKETVEQGLVEPCFLISNINTRKTQELTNRYFINNHFCIQYFPKSKNSKYECNEVSEKLYYILEYIDVDSLKIRGTNTNAEFDNDVLSFFINYNTFLYKNEIVETMQEKQLYQTVK